MAMSKLQKNITQSHPMVDRQVQLSRYQETYPTPTKSKTSQQHPPLARPKSPQNPPHIPANPKNKKFKPRYGIT